MTQDEHSVYHSHIRSYKTSLRKSVLCKVVNIIQTPIKGEESRAHTVLFIPHPSQQIPAEELSSFLLFPSVPASVNVKMPPSRIQRRGNLGSSSNSSRSGTAYSRPFNPNGPTARITNTNKNVIQTEQCRICLQVSAQARQMDRLQSGIHFQNDNLGAKLRLSCGCVAHRNCLFRLYAIQKLNLIVNGMKNWLNQNGMGQVIFLKQASLLRNHILHIWQNEFSARCPTCRRWLQSDHLQIPQAFNRTIPSIRDILNLGLEEFLTLSWNFNQDQVKKVAYYSRVMLSRARRDRGLDGLSSGDSSNNSYEESD